MTATNGSVVTTYTYDARNKMTGFASGTTTATYAYDDAGNRVRETTGGTTTYYLTDEQNPTGYARPVEQRSSPAAAPILSYMVGDRVYGQSAAGLTTYLVADGHGSTVAVTDASGAVTKTLAYTAYGDPLNFAPSMTGVIYLFGGDAVYDPASGLYLHGDGVRPTNGFYFTQMDGPGYGTNADPVSLHKYLYANADPVNGWDPTGHYTQAFGYAAHAVIGAAYEATHPYSIINPTTGVFSALKPDIYDPLNQGYAEIKPLSFPGVTSGLLQIVSYDEVYGMNGELGLNYHRITDWPASPTFATVVAADGESDEVVYFNVDGLIFYTNLVEDVEDLKQLRNPSQLYQFLRDSVKNKVQDIVDTVKNLVKKLSGEEDADLADTEAAATLDSAEGAP